LFNKPVIIGAKDSPLQKHISQTKEIVLNHDQSIFTFRFIALNYINSEKNQYAYIMEGLEKDWNYVGNKKEATYTNLNPGEYTFRVKASNNDGHWNEEGTSIKIIILPPWWNTILFRILVLVFVLGSFIGFYRIRIKILKNQKLYLENLVKERTLEIEEKNSLLSDQAKELSEVNTLLEERQEEVTIQNEELEIHRNQLEQLITERTSELVIAKIKAEESDKLKSSFLANMSHEIRTPMNAIFGFSGLLKDDSVEKEEKSKFIDIILDNCESLLVLIDDILDISRIEVDRLEFTFEMFNVDDIFINLETFFSRNTDKNVSFEFVNKAGNNGLVLYSDKIRFKQILTNFMDNARKFTDSGHIKFGYFVNENNVQFFVSDTGIGIEKSEIDKIFNHFYKIENNPGKVYRGTGLGLTICKKIIEMMGGKIWVESTINEGSTFNFTLPNVHVLSLSKIEKKNKEQKKINLEKFTILVAEDTETNYELINAMLKPYGADIKWAKDGQQAIDFIKNNKDIEKCIVLMDIKMPVVDGYEANRQIKEINNKIPVIAVTAYAQAEDRENILKNKFADYISKPIKMETLLNLLFKYSKMII
jgi:signal transduction histidine kinase/ActR/RegA family two-component response regulator